MGENNEKLNLIMNNLTPAMVEKAQTELGETEEVRAKALEQLRILVKNEKNLEIPPDNAFLLRYLRARKFNVPKAFKLIQSYFNFRQKYRSILENSNAERITELFMKHYMGLSLFRDKNGCALFFAKIALWNPEIDTLEHIIQAMTGLLVYAIQFPATQVCGFRFIVDFRGVSWTQLKMGTPSNILFLIYSTQFCFPGRYKGAHIISDNKFFNLVRAIIYPFLTSKLKSRVMFHRGDSQILQEYVHSSVLPIEFGGAADPFNNESWKEILLQACQTTIEELKYGYKD